MFDGTNLIHIYKGFLASSLSTYDFSTIYISLPFNPIEEYDLPYLLNKLYNNRSRYIWCVLRNPILSLQNIQRNILCSCQKVCGALQDILDKIFLSSYINCIDNCMFSYGYPLAPLVADLSPDMRFPTMRYVRPAKAQTSLRIRAV